MVVHGAHGCLSFSLSSKADEAETTTAQSGTVLDDDLGWRLDCSLDTSKWVTDSFFDLAELLEPLTKGLIVGMPRQAAVSDGLVFFFNACWMKIPG